MVEGNQGTNKQSTASRAQSLAPVKRKILLLKIPQTDKEDVREKVLAYRVEPHIVFSKFFEQLLVNFHKLFSRLPISLEVVTYKQHIYYYFYVDEKFSQLLRGQIYAMYPTCEIEVVDDYLDFSELKKTHDIAASEVRLKMLDIFPIKIYEEFKKDSMAGILSVLAKAEAGEMAWIQLVIYGQPDNGAFNFRQNMKKRFNRLINIFRIKYYFKHKGMKGIKIDHQASFESKNSGEHFYVSMRTCYLTPKNGPHRAKDKLKVLNGALNQYNKTDYNGFVPRNSLKKETLLKRIEERKMGYQFLLSDKEVATVFHLPNEEEVPNIVHVMAKKSEPPNDLPTDDNGDNTKICFFGMTNFHNQYFKFGINRIDRRRHLYVVGKSGSGKSKMLELLMKNDLESGQGICVLDPHGDLVDNMLRFVPENRIKDVVLIDPTDMQHPVGFNLLEDVPDDMKVRVTIGIIDIFKKLFGANWTTRLEHVLRYTCLALLDSENTTVLSILKMLSDKNYRQSIVSRIKDNVVKNFWVNEFASWSEKFDNEAITPLLNKVGQFVSTSLIRNIVGQPVNQFSIREIMDDGKILLIKVSKGILGEENAQLLGAMMITKIYQAAMARADTLEENRRDFYLYVDEFQNFATDTFGEILSEARKYRLNLCIAHQFMGQLTDPIRKTVFGNVGSMVSFRVGAEDARILEKEYNPVFQERDFINLGVRDFYVKMSINGQTKDAFSGRSLTIKYPEKDNVAAIKEHVRTTYAMTSEEVEELLKRWDESGGEGDFSSLQMEEEFAPPII